MVTGLGLGLGLDSSSPVSVCFTVAIVLHSDTQQEKECTVLCAMQRAYPVLNRSQSVPS